jgi:hypothetical protein
MFGIIGSYSEPGRSDPSAAAVGARAAAPAYEGYSDCLIRHESQLPH